MKHWQNYNAIYWSTYFSLPRMDNFNNKNVTINSMRCPTLSVWLHLFAVYLHVCGAIFSEGLSLFPIINKNFTLSLTLFIIFGFSSFPFTLLCPQEEEEMQTKLVLWMIIFCLWCSGFQTTRNVIIAFPSLSGLWLPKACLDPLRTSPPHTQALLQAPTNN